MPYPSSSPERPRHYRMPLFQLAQSPMPYSTLRMRPPPRNSMHKILQLVVQRFELHNTHLMLRTTGSRKSAWQTAAPTRHAGFWQFQI